MTNRWSFATAVWLLKVDEDFKLRISSWGSEAIQVMNHWIWSISAATIPKWIAINKISKQILSRWFTADLTLPQNLELDTSHRPFRQLYRCNKLLLRTVPLQHCAAMAGHPFIVKWRGETVTENAWKGGCYWRISLGLFLGWWGGLWICLSNVVNLKIHNTPKGQGQDQ